MSEHNFQVLMIKQKGLAVFSLASSSPTECIDAIILGCKLDTWHFRPRMLQSFFFHSQACAGSLDDFQSRQQSKLWMPWHLTGVAYLCPFLSLEEPNLADRWAQALIGLNWLEVLSLEVRRKEKQFSHLLNIPVTKLASAWQSKTFGAPQLIGLCTSFQAWDHEILGCLWLSWHCCKMLQASNHELNSSCQVGYDLKRLSQTWHKHCHRQLNASNASMLQSKLESQRSGGIAAPGL